MAKTRAQKSLSVEQLTDAFKKGKSAVFADYQGMKVIDITNLRKQLDASKVDYIVAKKSLLSLAAKAAGFEINFKSMPGMLGVAFSEEDEMAPAKIIGDAGKEKPIKLVGGIFEGKTVDQAYVIALSKLPSKKQLLGQLLSVMNGPASSFARLVNAYREKQEKESGAAPSAEAPAAA
ncbi:MAG TPA: 50S ribosomal protein L10 [Patescibacteria group bacterium]|nr:50S ribosomal protein L10 [Patescibacteria group bacterium]